MNKKIILLVIAIPLLFNALAIAKKKSRCQRAKMGQKLYRNARAGNCSKCLEAINRHADLNYIGSSSGNTPLHRASQNGHLSTVQLLVGKGAKINLKNKSGKTPLSITKNEEIKNYLKSRGGRE